MLDDRSYMQEPQYQPKNQSAVVLIIIINVVVFLVGVFTASQAHIWQDYFYLSKEGAQASSHVDDEAGAGLELGCETPSHLKIGRQGVSGRFREGKLQSGFVVLPTAGQPPKATEASKQELPRR